MYQAKEEELGMIKKNDRGDFIRIARIIPAKGNEAIDIRMFYTDEMGQLRPTSKGIRISTEKVAEVIRLMMKGLKIEEYEELLEEVINNEG